MDVAVALLKIAPGVSRVHASRRVFEQLQQQKVCAAVVSGDTATWQHWLANIAPASSTLHCLQADEVPVGCAC